MTFDQLAKLVFDQHIRYDPEQDLPTPNVYWCTVSGVYGTLHAYIAGDHTRLAMQSFQRWCENTHDMWPTKSNSVIKLRRLKLGSLLETPSAFQAALDTARANGERGNVAMLETLPYIIARQLGLTVDLAAGWAKVCESTLAPRQLRA